MKDNKSGSKKTIHPFIIFHFVLFLIFLVLAIYDTVRGDIRLDWKLAIATVVIFFDLVYVFRKRQKEDEEKLRLAGKRDRFKNLLLSNMSRDVRTPMNAIVGFTDLALRADAGKEQMRDYLDRIRSSAQHLMSIIDDVMEFSRIENGETKVVGEPINLPELMNHVTSITCSRAEAKNHTVNLVIGRLMDENVSCDRHIIEQILLNITYNAIKHTQEDGKIQVGVSQAGPPDERGAVYEFTVKDSSRMMTQERVKQIRDVFEQDDRYANVGIDDFDLSIAKKLVDILGGVIEFEFEPETGMEITLTFLLPVCEQAQEKSESVKAQHYQDVHVLVVDDMMINRQIVCAILKVYGIKTDEAKDGEEAIAALKGKPSGYYDVVLMDVQMPNLDGYEAARRIREMPDTETASVPIFAMTANVLEKDKKTALDAGMDGFIPKPVDRQELMELLSGIFDSKKEGAGE